MSHELIRVPFDQGEILCIQDDRGEFVVLKPLCERLGVDDRSQRKRIQRAAWGRTCGVIMTLQIPGDDQRREVFTLHRRRLAMWLATMDASRVRKEVRPYLEALQERAADVLDAFFLGGKVLLDPEELQQQIASEIARQLQQQPAAPPQRIQLDLNLGNVPAAERASGAVGGTAFSDLRIDPEIAEQYKFPSVAAWNQFVKRNPELRAFRRGAGLWDGPALAAWFAAHPEAHRPRQMPPLTDLVYDLLVNGAQGSVEIGRALRRRDSDVLAAIHTLEEAGLLRREGSRTSGRWVVSVPGEDDDDADQGGELQ